MGKASVITRVTVLQWVVVMLKTQTFKHIFPKNVKVFQPYL